MAMDPNVSAIIREMKYRFDYEMEMYDDDCNYILFKRTTEGRTHALVIEDHTFERSQRDFDPQKDTGDWLIFSMLLDDERGWFGNYVETQYPLTLGEFKLIERLIKAINESHVPPEEKKQDDICVDPIPMEWPKTGDVPWQASYNNYVPEACAKCMNHPINGGSGICHCTLGSMTIT